MEKNSLGKFITAARLKAGLTGPDFEKRFNISNQILWTTEGGILPRPSTFVKIKAALVALGEDPVELERLYLDSYIKRRERSRKRRTSTNRREKA